MLAERLRLWANIKRACVVFNGLPAPPQGFGGFYCPCESEWIPPQPPSYLFQDTDAREEKQAAFGFNKRQER